MRRFLITRFLSGFMSLFGALTLLFLVVRLAPGDPTSRFIDVASMDSSVVLKQRELWRLDDPIHVQYVRYLHNLVTLRFGTSFTRGTPVRDILVEKLGNTLVLMLPSIVIIVILSSVWGTLAGWYRGSVFERASITLSLSFRSMPSFFFGILLLMIFAYRLQWFPSGGMAPVGTALSFSEKVFSPSFLKYLALPALAIILRGTNDSFLVMRTSVIEVKGEDFLEILHAKGLSQVQILKHVARNALLPYVTYIAVLVGFLFQGQVIVETLFAWPGIGREIVLSLSDQDYPVMQGAFSLVAVAVISMNFLVDVLYSYLDPRVRYE